MLPKVPEDPNKKTAEWGKEVHSWKETGFPPTQRVADWLTYQPLDPWEIRTKFWGGGTHELFLRFQEDFSVTSGGTRETNHGGLIRGIADFVGNHQGWGHITDLKTGRFIPDDRPSQTPQLLLYGDIWLRLPGNTGQQGLCLSLDWWPRYPKGNLPQRIGPDFVSRQETEDWHNSQLIPAINLSRKPGAKYDARPGQHCMYCKSQPWCVAQGGKPPA